MAAAPVHDRSCSDALRATRSSFAHKWRQALLRMSLVDDFQAREYYKLTAAWAERQGESLEFIGLMMRWQAECMLAFADNRMPPNPPPGIDLAKLAAKQQQQQSPTVMGQVMASAQAVDSKPFTGDEAAFESTVVRDEYVQLCKDHGSTITLGERYGTFDAMGKLAFLDQLDAIEERWDVFYARFALLGALNPEFENQTSAFLNSMGMDAAQFREILGEAHALMRAEAEAERLA